MEFRTIDPELLENSLVQEKLRRMALAIEQERERQLQERVDEEGCSEVFATFKAVLWGWCNRACTIWCKV